MAKEGKNVAALVAAKTVKDPLEGMHMERRGFFPVKRTKAQIALPTPLELDVFADQFGDAHPVADLQ
jgi:hypothetical protein